MDHATPSPASNDNRLADDFRAVISDAEQLLRHAVKDAGEGYNEARERLEASLLNAREELADLQASTVDGARRAARAGDGYVRQHPWESIAISAGVGLLLGLLIARR